MLPPLPCNTPGDERPQCRARPLHRADERQMEDDPNESKISVLAKQQRHPIRWEQRAGAPAPAVQQFSLFHAECRPSVGKSNTVSVG
jgi:hypothetical protein